MSALRHHFADRELGGTVEALSWFRRQGGVAGNQGEPRGVSEVVGAMVSRHNGLFLLVAELDAEARRLVQDDQVVGEDARSLLAAGRRMYAQWIETAAPLLDLVEECRERGIPVEGAETLRIYRDVAGASQMDESSPTAAANEPAASPRELDPAIRDAIRWSWGQHEAAYRSLGR
ncbi:hypothetical protein EP7_000013 [Isosphaeraceae bacterium EP7]